MKSIINNIPFITNEQYNNKKKAKEFRKFENLIFKLYLGGNRVL